jgi:tetratricopeptide (TPR) repeat protein
LGQSQYRVQSSYRITQLGSDQPRGSYLPAEETSDFNFIEMETQHLGYLTEFTLSEVLFEAGEAEEAQQRLEESIARAEREHLGESIPKDLSEGYFLQGLMFDPGVELDLGQNPNPGLQKSIEAYSRSVELNAQQYAARLNLGILHAENGEAGKAIEDYTQLIVIKSRLSLPPPTSIAPLSSPTREAAESDLAAAIELSPAEGYFFRAIARRDWGDTEGAIADFNSAITADPETPFPYHELGLLQLEAGMYAEARDTYETLATRLEDEFRDIVINDLSDLGERLPAAKDSASEIIKEVLKK